MRSEPTISHSTEVCPPFCATITFESLAFAPLIYALKNQISSKKSSKTYYMGDFHLQLHITDLNLEFGTDPPSSFKDEHWLYFLPIGIDCTYSKFVTRYTNLLQVCDIFCS